MIEAERAVPLLRVLDATGRGLLRGASTRRTWSAGTVVFAPGDAATTLYVVQRGRVDLRIGSEIVRRVDVGDSFGEEACLGLPRGLQAIADEDTELEVIPAALAMRGLGRIDAAASPVAALELRRLRRQAMIDAVRASALRRVLEPEEVGVLVDLARWVERERGATLYERGDPVDGVGLVLDGLVRVTAEGGAPRFADPGTLFGGDEFLARHRRTTTAVAESRCRFMSIPPAAVELLIDRQPRFRAALEQPLREPAPIMPTATADPFRFETASSMLLIDASTCVRCGHCAWSCAETHGGVARMRRAGPLVQAELPEFGAGARPLLLANACQHCRNPACLVDCPVGAIAMGDDGRVSIDEATCTGCGACVRACPWDNLTLAPRPDVPADLSPGKVAVKCDLCRGADGPACLAACPVGSIVRVEPRHRLPIWTEPKPPRADVRPAPRPRLGPAIVAAASAGVIACVVASRFVEARAIGWAWFAGVTLLGAASYVVGKRIGLRRAWPKPSSTRALSIHIGLGSIVWVAAAMHAGLRFGSTSGGLLNACLWSIAGLGLLGTAAYRWLPPVLARLDGAASDESDPAGHRQTSLDAFFRGLTGQSEAVKTIARAVLVPYVVHPWGPIGLVLAGRTPAEDAAVLRGRIAARGSREHADALGPAIAAAVELRAGRARRWVLAALRGWLSLHIVVSVWAVLLLVVHAAVMGGRP